MYKLTGSERKPVPSSDPPKPPFFPLALTHTTEAELKEMILRADADQDGEVSFEDFYNIMTRRTFT